MIDMPKINRLNKYVVLTTVILCQLFTPAFAQMGPIFTYHGRLVDSATNTVVSGSVNFLIQLRSADASNCLMYEEVQSKLLSQGVFSLNVNSGAGTSTYSTTQSGISFQQIMSNTTPLNFNYASYSSAAVVPAHPAPPSGSCSFTPTPAKTDSRKLVVYFFNPADPSMVSWEPLPIQTVGYVPMAVEALNVGGFPSSSLLRFVDSAGNPTATAPLSNANYTELMALINGTSTTFLKATDPAVGFTGSLTGDVTGGQSSTVVSSLHGIPLSATAPVSGQYLIYNGTNWQATNGSGGTVKNVSSGNGYLSVTDPTLNPILTVNVGTAANTVAAGNDPRIVNAMQSGATAGGDLSGTLPNPSVAMVGGKTAAAVAASVTDTANAVAIATPSTLVKRDSSGNASFVTASATHFSGRDILVYDNTNTKKITITAPTLAADLNLVLPATSGTSGFVLMTDGAGNTSWANPTTGAVTAVNATAPLISSGGFTPTISIPAATTAVDGYLKATDWNTFNNKLSTALPTGQAWVGNAGGIAAAKFLNSSDIRSTAAGNASWFSVAAGCPTGQALNYNLITDNVTCQAYALTSSQVTTALGFTPTSNALPANQIFVGNAGGVATAVPLSGDAAIVSSGAITINSNAITTGKIADGAITNAKITDLAWPKITGHPTTIAGYGITDAVLTNAGGVTDMQAATLATRPTAAAAPNRFFVSKDTGETWYSDGTTWTKVGSAVGLGGTVTSVATGTGLTGGPITNSGTISLANTAVTAGAYGSASAVPSFTVDAQGRLTAAGSGAYQDATAAAKGIVQIGNNISVTAGTISLNNSNVTGALGYTPVNKAGDTMSGALAMGGNDITGTGNIIMNANKSFGLGNFSTAQETTLTATLLATDKGRTWFNSTTNKMMYWDGTTAQVMANIGAAVTNVTATAPVVSSGGATPNISMAASTAAVDGYLKATDFVTFNSKLTSTLTNGKVFIGNATNVATEQSLSGDATISNTGVVALKNTGTAGSYGTSTSIPAITTDAQGRVSAVTMNAIPTANTTTTGLLTGADWTTFNNKQAAGNYLTALTGDVTAAGPGSAVSTISANAITTGKIANLAVTDAKINDVAWPKITSHPTTIAGYGITDAVLTNAGGVTDMQAATLATRPTAAAAPNRFFVSKDTGETWYSDGTTWTKVGSAVGLGGTVTNVSVVGAPLSVINPTTTPQITITQANTTTPGYITGADYTAFTNKLTSVLSNGKIFIGNATNVATEQTLSGDATISNSGALTLANTAVTAGTYGSASAVPSFTVDGKGRLTLAGSNAYQDATAVGKGIVQVGTNLQVTGGVLSLQNADGTHTGALTSADWATFNGKQNALGYVPVNKAGDTMTGALAMGGNDITGIGNLVTTGNVTVGGNLQTGNILVGSNKTIGLGQLTTAQQTALVGTLAATDQGKTWYNTTTNQMMYWDGSAAQVVASASGAVTAVSATAPLVSSGGLTPTISIPAATTAVDGYLKATDWTTFNSKQAAGNYITALTGDVTAAGPGSSASTIAVSAVTTSKIADGAITNIKVTDVAWGKITGTPTTIAGYGITDAQSKSLTNGKIRIGDATNMAAEQTMSGDATITNAGVVALKNTGTAGTYGSSTAVPTITTDAQGRVTAVTINAIPTANTTTSGILTSTDWNTFNNKLGTSTLFAGDVSGTASTTSVDKLKGTALSITAITSGNFLKYNGTNWVNAMLGLSDIPNMDAAHMPAFTGDITTTAGSTVTSLKNTGTAGTYGTSTSIPAITTDAQGRVTAVTVNAIPTANTTTSGILTSADWNTFNGKQVALGFTPVNKAGDTGIGSLALSTNTTLGLGQLTSAQQTTLTGTLAAADKGKTWFNSTTNQMMYWDGSAAQVIASASGAVTAVSATAPLVSSGGLTPTISIPAATTAVDGYLKATDWTTFNSKQAAGNYITALTGDVTAAGPGSSASTIAASAVTTIKIADLAVTDAKINDVAWGKITLATRPTTLGGYGITDAISSTLNSGKILVGNATNVATPVSMTGDVTMDNAGVTALKNTGTAGTYGSSTAVPTITTDAQGRITAVTSNAYADATGLTKGIVQIGSNITNTAGVISLTGTNVTNALGFTPASSSLASGKIFIGNAGGVATAQSLSGDATVDNAGVVTLSSTTTAGTVGSASAIPSITYDAKGRITSVTTNAYQDGTSAAKGILQVGTNLQVAGGVLSLQNADATHTGALTSTDWTTFNSKQAALGYTPVNKAGDSMTGALAMGGNNITGTGNIDMSASKTLLLSNNTTNPSGLTAADKGRTWFNSTTNQMMYWDGSAAQTLASASGSLSSLNGLTGTSQTFAVGTAGTDFGISSVGTVHTFNIPNASAANRGALTSADWTTFNSKQVAGNYITALTGDVTAAGPGSSASTIAASAVTTSKIADGAITNIKVTDVAWGKITGTPTTIAGYGITDAQSKSLTNGKIRIGDATNMAAEQTMSGDATITNAGVVALKNTGTAGTYGSSTSVPTITTDAQGRITAVTSNAYADATAITKGIVQVGTNLSVTAGVLNLATANTTTTGALTSTDWNTFNNKLGTSTLFAGDVSGTASTTSVDKLKGTALSITAITSGNFLKYNGTNWVNAMLGLSDIPNMDAAHMPAFTGDITTTAGSTVTSLKNTGTAGTYGTSTSIPAITTDAQGRVTAVTVNAIPTANTTTSGILTSADWNTFNGKQVALGFTPVNKAGDTGIGSLALSTNTTLGLGQLTSAQQTTLTGTLAAADKGKTWFNSTTNQMMYWDGSAAQVIASASGAVTAVSATAPLVSSGGLTPTISIPAATTAVDGYLKATDWTTFNSKQAAGNYITALTGDVTAAGPGSSASTIAASAVTTIKIADLAVTDAKINDVAWGKITLATRPTTLGGYGITDAISSTLNSGKILVGNATNVATPVSMTGDVTMDNAGVTALKNTGTAGTYGSSTAVPTITTDAQGRITAVTSNAYADATGLTKGIVQIGSNITNTAGVISLTGTNVTNALGFTPASSSLASGKIFIGNAGGVATAQSLSGDATVDNAGVVTLSSTTTAGTVGSASAIPSITYDAKGRITSVTTNAYQDGTSAAKGILQVGTNLQVAGGVLSLQNADATHTGALTSTDWTTFNSKQAALGYTPVNKAGDSMTGALAMGGNNITGTGNIDMSASKTLLLSNNTTNPSGLTAADKGRTWFNSTTNQMMYWDGSAAQTLASASGSLSSLNGLTGTSQTFAVGTAGTDFGISSVGTVHTFNIPNASAANRGALTSADWTTFNSKQVAGNYITALTGDVTAAGPGSSASTIAASAVTTSKIADGAITNIKVTDVAWGKITGTPTTIAGYGITDAQSKSLTNGKIRIGDATNMAAEQTMSGDATITNAGVVALKNTGTAGTYGSSTSVPTITTDAQGRITAVTSNAYADATAITKGIVQVGTNLSVTAGVLNLATANTTTTGALTSTDWNTFNNKLGTSTLFAGDVSGTASTTSVDKLKGTALSITAITSGNFLKYNGTNWVNAMLGLSDIPNMDAAHMPAFSGDITTTAGSTATTISANAVTTSKIANLAVTDAKINDVAWTKITSVPTANTTTSGIISSTDWNTFNGKQAALGYVPVNKAGDTGLGSLALSTNTTLGLGQLTSAQQTTLTGTLAAADKGKTWFNSTTNQMMYWDGSAAQTLASASGSLSSLNGLTGTSQTFAVGTAGTDFGISSVGTVHTFNIPNASAANRGALTSADWTTFNSKLTSSLAAGNIFVGNAGGVATGVAMTGDATISNAGAVTLKNTGTAGSYGTSTSIPAITTDAQGRVTAVTVNAIPTANTTTTGLISSTDWNTFNGKQNGSAELTGLAGLSTLGFVKRTAAGTYTASNIALSTDVSGTLPVANGGTGASTLAAGSLVVGNGTSAVSGLAGGATGNVIYATSATGFASGTPDTAGLVDKSSAQTISGAKTHTNYMQMNAQNEIRFADSTSAHYVGFKSPATVAANLIWTLPAADGTSGQVLKTDGAGSLSWTSAAVGTVTSVTSANTDIGVATGTTTPVLTLNSGTGANQIVKLNGTAQLPAVDGSLLTGFTAAQIPNLDAAKITTGTLPITRGGTGAVTANAALNNLLPTQTANVGKFLQTDGTNSTWVTGNAGTVTSIATGTGLTGGPITSSGTISLASTAVTAGTYGSASAVPSFTVDAQGRLTAAGSNAYQDATAASKGIIQVGTNLSVTSGVLNLATANTTTTGALTSTDWNTFNNKTSSQWTTTGSDIYYNTGKVGIGTTSPVFTLDINGSGETVLSSKSNATTGIYLSKMINGNNEGVFFTHTGGDNSHMTGSKANTVLISADYFVPGSYRDLAFGTSGNERLRIDVTGKVGIGTNTPAYKMDVAGDVNVTGNFKINGVNISNTNGTVTSVTGTAPVSVATGTTTPVISMAAATTAVDGYLKATDWTTFNNKMTNVLNSGLIFVGNASNVATGVAMSGDAVISNTGAVTLQNTATARSDLGLGIADSPTHTGMTLSGLSTAGLVKNSIGGVLSTGKAVLTTDVSGILPVANGGTGVATVATANQFLANTTAGSAPAFRSIASTDINTVAFVQGGNNFGGPAVLGVSDTTNTLTLQTNNGAVPGAKLTMDTSGGSQFNGQAWSVVQTSAAATTLPFDTNAGNTLRWTTAGTGLTANITNMKPGASYMLVIKGAGTDQVTITCSNTGTVNTVPALFVPANAARVGGTSASKSVYTLLYDGENCLVTWITGY